MILETTLKVFHSADEEHIRQVCAHMFRLWRPLTDQVDTVSVLLWVGEGTEILVYKGDLDEPFEYGRYCGFANWQYPHAYEGPNSRESRKAEVVLKDPPVFTYGLLRTVVSSFREMGAEITGKPVTVGATFDPGPEFAESPWKYALHNEVFPQITGEERRKKAVFFLNAFARLEADSEVYAGFPDGISKGTSFGVFFGRQCHHFLTDLGYDYVWFSNGFGFSHYGTSTFGDAFDGATYRPELTHPFAEKTLSFWRDFRRECPTFPVETRGTNYSAGLDLASDGVPLREIYGGDFDMAPPVNSPWGALDADFGLELTGYMTRMAEIPGADYPFRFYSLDPWFQFSPWFDVYEQVEAIGAVTPEHYRLDLDWNGMLMNVGTATPVMQRLDQYERVSIYESPINQADVEGQRELRRKVAKPIAIHFGSPAFPTAVKESVCDGFVIGGSVATVLRQGELAGAFEKPFWLQMVGTGLVTALSAHLGAVLPFAQWPTITCLNNYIDDLLVEPLTIRGGFLQVPEGPGLGVEVDEEALSQYAMEPPYRLPDERHILTVVWPGGRAVHFANIHDHCWPHFRTHGNDPAQEPGATLEIWDDDGSQEWADLYERLQAGPIREQRS